MSTFEKSLAGGRRKFAGVGLGLGIMLSGLEFWLRKVLGFLRVYRVLALGSRGFAS